MQVSPTQAFPQILVRRDVDLKAFREEILPAARPVVFADLVSDWPIVHAARESPRAFAESIRKFDRGRPVIVIDLPHAADGKLFYRDDLSGLNFTRTAGQIGATLDRLLAIADDPQARTLFIESMAVDDFLPEFAATHANPLLDAAVRPRIWIGNRIKVQTHYDLQYNIACCIAGRRRFTLFPPDQVANLYPGPIEFTPSGTPISMVPLTAPDHAKYPKFAEALRHATQAELGPGDAIYIPYGWWHHVESLTPLNGLVNYWWNDARNLGAPYAVLLHAAMTLRDMPEDQRAVWRSMFEHLVFTDPDVALAHLTPQQRGLLGPPDAKRVAEVRNILAQTFSPTKR
jgi:hypothetical protein